MGYRANPDSLDRAGTSAESAGNQASRVDLGRPSADIGRAMPGGASERAAQQLSQSWTGALKKWSAAAEEHGASLKATAREYRDTDRSNSERFAQRGAR